MVIPNKKKHNKNPIPIPSPFPILISPLKILNLFPGGANAGHTIVVNKKKFVFHLLPCGILYPQCLNVLGNGVVVNVRSMLSELEQLD